MAHSVAAFDNGSFVVFGNKALKLGSGYLIFSSDGSPISEIQNVSLLDDISAGRSEVAVLNDNSMVFAWNESLQTDNHVDIALRHIGPPVNLYHLNTNEMAALGVSIPEDGTYGFFKANVDGEKLTVFKQQSGPVELSQIQTVTD